MVDIATLNLLDVDDPFLLLGDESSRLPAESVQMVGILIGKDRKHVFLKTPHAIHRVPVDAILSLEVDNSQPSQDQLRGAMEVVVSVKSTTTVGVLRVVCAAALSGEKGMRPLVYAIPSDTARYAVPISASSRLQCPSSTSRHSPSQTLTTCPRPTWDPQTGDRLDAVSDFEDDYQTDYETDWISD